jgi:two-component system, LytTR family, sensor kinase
MNRLDQHPNKHLQTLERVLDFYNGHWWLRASVHLAYFSSFTYSVYYRYDYLNITNYGPYFWLFCGTIIASYYYIFYLLIPQLLPRKRYAWFALLFLVWYFVPFSYVSFKYNEEIELLNNHYLQNQENPNQIWIKKYEQFGLWGHFESMLFVYSVFCEFVAGFISIGFIKAIKYFLDNTVRERKLNRLNYELEAKYLQHQLNPHFLFNSLNNIYGLILQRNKDTPQIISQFQGLINHSLQQLSSNTIPLQTEIDYLKNYINLEKIRHGANLTITHNFDTAMTTNHAIAPRMLLPFVENAFKHGANRSIEKAFINIKLTTQNNQIEFEVENNKPVLLEKQSKMGGIGLKNISRRLALLYPDHRLTITDNESVYKITLRLAV